MNKFEYIKSKNIDELADWLDKHDSYDAPPWIEWFNENYCSKCDPEVALYEGRKEMEFSWCELHDECRFFEYADGVPDNKQIIKLWLESEEQVLDKCYECDGLGFVTKKDDAQAHRCECVRCGGIGSIKVNENE